MKEVNWRKIAAYVAQHADQCCGCSIASGLTDKQEEALDAACEEYPYARWKTEPSDD